MITIYRIKNLKNDKIYIGQTGSTIQARFNNHKSKARSKKDNCLKLCRAIRKYGEDSFTIEEIDNTETREQANELETFYIRKFDSVKRGYNMRYDGFSQPHTEATKQKLSKLKLGTKYTEEAKNKISIAMTGDKNPFYGKTHSKATKKLMSENKKGNTIWLGRHHTEETKQKLSTSKKGTQAGENNPSAKLTLSDVEKIRSLFKEKNLTIKKIANMFNVSASTIDKIKSGDIWK